MASAWSLIGLTALAGAAQGQVAVLVVARWAGVVVSVPFTAASLAVALTMLCAALGAWLVHLDHARGAQLVTQRPRAPWWASVAIMLSALIAALVLWWLALLAGLRPHAALAPVLLFAFALWWSTAATAAGEHPSAELGHPLVQAGLVLAGLSSGALLTCALAALSGEERLLVAIGPWAVGLVALAGGVQAAAFVRRARKVSRSTAAADSGTHAEAPAPRSTPWPLKWLALGFGQVLPLVLMVYAITRPIAWPWLSALLLLVPGLLVERWLLLAPGRASQGPQHPAAS